MITQFKYFKSVQFALPWWAYSFPVAAITIATMIMQEKVGGIFFDVAVPLLYVALLALLTVLVINTIRAILQKKICVPE